MSASNDHIRPPYATRTWVVAGRTRGGPVKQAGFTLTEIAVVLLIVGLLLGGMLYTYSAQVDQSNRLETQRRLESAKDLLIAYAIVNGRLPCPASTSGSTPSHSGDTSTACTEPFTGFLPGSTIGFQPVDASGFALDSWNNRLRYAISQTIVSGTVPHFTNSTNLKSNGVSTQPNDLVICVSSTGTTPLSVPSPSCGTSISVTNQKTLAAIVLSPGKNGASLTTGRADENINNKQIGPPANANHALFVYRPYAGIKSDIESRLEEFDDQMVWIPAGQLYARLISAGILP